MKHEQISKLRNDLHKRRNGGIEYMEEPKYVITLTEMNIFIRALDVTVQSLDIIKTVENMSCEN